MEGWRFVGGYYAVAALRKYCTLLPFVQAPVTAGGIALLQ